MSRDIGTSRTHVGSGLALSDAFVSAAVMVSSDVVAVVDGQGVQVYVMDADGSGRTRLTDNPAADASPSWSMQ